MRSQASLKMLAPLLYLSDCINSMITKLNQPLFGLIVVTAMVIAGAAPTTVSALTCGGAETSIIGGEVCKDAKDNGTGDQSAIWAILILVLNIMTAGVGVAAVGGIVYGAVLYSSAGDKADQTKKAIGIITNVVIGIIAYAFMYLILNFLIPGGIFS